MERCTFTYNAAKQFYASGAGLEQARGGGISSFNEGLTVKDCVFHDNSANAGGALFVWGSATIVNCLFERNDVYNMITGGITQSGHGSAIGVWTPQGERVRIDNCLIRANNVVGGESGAISAGGVEDCLVTNTILWANTAPPPASPRQKHYRGLVQLSHDCIENLFVPDANDPVPPPSEIPGCIDQDPAFADAPNGDLHLAAGSACIDAGSNAQVPGIANTDLDGRDLLHGRHGPLRVR